MHIEVNASHDIKGGESLQAEVAAMIEGSIGRFSEHLTRVEAHISDTNGPKGGDSDIRCALEARPAGLQPLAVTANGPNVAQAVDAAAEKLARALDTLVGKQMTRQRSSPGTGHLSVPDAE